MKHFLLNRFYNKRKNVFLQLKYNIIIHFKLV